MLSKRPTDELKVTKELHDSDQVSELRAGGSGLTLDTVALLLKKESTLTMIRDSESKTH